MADDFFAYDDEDLAPKKRDNLFLWTVFILLLTGLAFACWLGSFYVFGHPEQPRNYRILQRVKKIDPPKRFEDTKGPLGEFLSAQRLFERYSKYSRLQLERENAELLRTFVTNYRETKKLVPYARGNFTIADAAPLTVNDFMTSGMVALGQSNDFPQVVIEHLYPMNADELAKSRRLLAAGNPIKLEKTNDLGAIIHIEKIPDGRLQFTIAPLMYPPYGLEGVGTFRTEPPADLHLEAGLPVMKPERVEKALKILTDFRRSQPTVEPLAEGDTPPQVPQIVRLDAVPEGTKIPVTGPLPEMPVATPIPIAGRTGPTPRKTAAELALLTKNAPPSIAVATPIPRGEPVPATGAAPVARRPDGVLKPFIASNPQPGLPTAEGNSWRTFKPGAVPAGKALLPEEASPLADRGAVAARTYLKGKFLVSASGDNRAVLRPEAVSGADVRVIVEYPNGAVPPTEGMAVERDETRPYEIRDVRRGVKGELNIWVREIVQE